MKNGYGKRFYLWKKIPYGIPVPEFLTGNLIFNLVKKFVIHSHTKVFWQKFFPMEIPYGKTAGTIKMKSSIFAQELLFARNLFFHMEFNREN